MTQRIVDPDSRDRPGTVVREPDRIVTDTQSVAAGPGPLAKHVSRMAVHNGQRNFGERRPNLAVTELDVAAMPWRPQGGGLNDSSLLGIDSRKSSVALVERPYRSGS